MQACETKNGGRPVVRRMAWVIGTFVAAAVVFWIAWVTNPPRELKPVWVSSSGEPTPKQFLYAMFPLDNAVPVCDAPDGKQVGVLKRAVVNSQEEIDQGGWVKLIEGNKNLWVELKRLTFVPDMGSEPDYFMAYMDSYRARDFTEWRGGFFETADDGSDTKRVRLRLEQDEHWQEWVYDVSGEKVTPIEMYQVFGPAVAFEELGRVMIALIAAISVLVFVGCGRLRAAKRRRVEAAAHRGGAAAGPSGAGADSTAREV